MVVNFYSWLLTQQDRDDDVGDYARRATKNVCYPRSSRLYVLLKHEIVSRRPLLKRAHREWRAVRHHDHAVAMETP